MGQTTKVDSSLKERRSILELIGRLRGDGITLQEMEQIGERFRQAGRRALRPLVRELWRESSGELITKYVYMLDFFDTESWLGQLIQIAIKRRDLGEDGKTALLVALEGYGVDVHAPPFQGAFAGVGNQLGKVVEGAIRLGEDGMVTLLDDFLSYPADVQKMVIRELPKAGNEQGARLLEAMLWHEETGIVQAALASLGRIRDPLAAAVLARFIKDGNPALTAEAKKSLQRLAFLGVQVPAPTPLLPFHACYATAPDGDGYRSLLVSRWVGEGSLSVLYLQVHERRGILAAWGAADLTEGGFQAELEGFSLQDDLVEAPAAHLLELVRDALYWSSDLCYLPADFYMRRGIFAGEKLTAAPYRPVFAEYPQIRCLSYREGEQITRELFADPFFAGWFMAAQRVHELAEQYRLGENSEKVLEQFCRELLTPDLELIRERLLLSADLMRHCGRDSRLVARVVALAGSLAGNPLPHHLHPFLRGFALESMKIARAAQIPGEEDRLQEVEKL